MESSLNHSQNLIILQRAIERGIISLDDVMSLTEDSLMNKLLSQFHPYSIFFSESDNRWHTTIADPTKVSGRKQIVRTKKSDLMKFLFNHYNLQLNMEQTSNKTFKEIFEITQEKKLQYIKSEEKILSAKNTQLKNLSDYKRYFSDTEFETMEIDKITKKDIENICLYNLQRYDMRKKAFASLRGILKPVFDMAYSEYWISDNVYMRVDFKMFKNMLQEEISIDQRVHSKEEVFAILDELHRKQQETPKISSIWALELQILMGLRRGEVPPLKWEDVSDTYITINKEQLTCGNDFIVVNHTKNFKDRYFPLTNDLKDFLRRLKIMHDMYYPNSIYLFPSNTASGIITNRAVYYVYRRICKKLGIVSQEDIIKGPHSFRRNAITDVVNATNGNIIMASELFGNTPDVAKQNYFTGTDLSLATSILNQRCLLTKK